MRLRDVGLILAGTVFIFFLLSRPSSSANQRAPISGSLIDRLHLRPRSIRSVITNDTVLWFLHMQKTGGTFFSAFLLFAFDCVCPANWRPEWPWSFTCRCPRRLMSMFSPGNASIYHANYTRILRHWEKDGFADQYSQLKVFTVLREPVARVMSEYHHCSKRRRMACWGSFHNVSDKDWLRVRRYPHMFFEHTAYEGHNRQTRMLLGEAWKTPASSYEVARLADAGIKRLEELEYVGISERLEESLHLFCWQFCLPCMNQTDELRTLLSYQINVQRSGYLTPRPFTKELMTFLHEENTVDRLVYKRATELFDERLAQMRRQQDRCPR